MPPQISATPPKPPRSRSALSERSSSQKPPTDPKRVLGGVLWQRFACLASMMSLIQAGPFFLTKKMPTFALMRLLKPMRLAP